MCRQPVAGRHQPWIRSLRPRHREPGLHPGNGSRLADTTIHAPFDGHVTDRAVAVGEFVGPGTRISTVMRLDPIKLRMQVPEVAAAKIRRGQTVFANVEALGNASVTATVTAVSAALDPATRAFIVEATAPNRDARLRAQMFATARNEIGASEAGVFIERVLTVGLGNRGSQRQYLVDHLAAQHVPRLSGSSMSRGASAGRDASMSCQGWLR